MSASRPLGGGFLLAASCALAAFASVLVVFVEPFRADESWYIYRARLGIELLGTVDAAAVLLRGWFQLFDGLWPGLLLLRAVTLSGYFLTVCACYLILRRSGTFSTPGPAFVASAAFASWLALNRGFEIRPEMLAHLSMLAAIAVGMGWKGLQGRTLVAALAILLFVPTTFSFRFWPISLALFFTLAGIGSGSASVRVPGFGRILAQTFGFLILVLLVHTLALDLVAGLGAASGWREYNDRQLGSLEKLRFAIGAPVILIFYALWATTIVLAGVVIRAALRKSNLILALLTLAPVAAYYLFFFLLEVKPYRYTRALEAVVLLSSCAVAFKLRLVQWPRSMALQMLVAGVLAMGTALAAYRDLSPRYHFLEAFFRHSVDLNHMSGGLDIMHSPDSLLQQISTRVDYCQEHPSQSVLIHRPQWHPFCGVDIGSVYNTGFRAYPDELRFGAALRSHGPILASISLKQDLSRYGFACSAAGKHYAICERDQGA